MSIQTLHKLICLCKIYKLTVFAGSKFLASWVVLYHIGHLVNKKCARNGKSRTVASPGSRSCVSGLKHKCLFQVFQYLLKSRILIGVETVPNTRSTAPKNGQASANLMQRLEAYTAETGWFVRPLKKRQLSSQQQCGSIISTQRAVFSNPLASFFRLLSACPLLPYAPFPAHCWHCQQEEVSTPCAFWHLYKCFQSY